MGMRLGVKMVTPILSSGHDHCVGKMVTPILSSGHDHCVGKMVTPILSSGHDHCVGKEMGSTLHRVSATSIEV